MKHDADDARADPLSLGAHTHHRAPQDLLLLCAETEAAGDDLFHWRHPPRVLQVAVRRRDRRDVWLLESLRVRASVRPPLRSLLRRVFILLSLQRCTYSARACS